MEKIVIAGGSGFLGQVLENHFKDQYQIKVLTRNPVRENDIYWDARAIGKWVKALENCKALINLAGKSVDCRYTGKNRKSIYDSRMDSTRILGEAINQCENPPEIWINSSTATIYRHSLDKEMTEEKGEIGNGFSMGIARSWEGTFNNIKNPETRKILIRTSIVMGKNGGAFIPLRKLTKLGLGGKQGSGNQKVSFIHEYDFARAVGFLINNGQLKGVFNLTVPKPTDNKTLMRSLRKVMKIPFGIDHPVWLLRLGAKIIGTETELVLKSRNVIPQRLLDNGFRFGYADIGEVVASLGKPDKIHP
ncbi:MAG: TIGR01777 family protein [Maribacter sp.]|nr:MAG: TIGR01777 family protein [Maribacter sp.]